MTVQSIFGLMADELIEISYLDAKLFNDQADEWRRRCRSALGCLKNEKGFLRVSRDLHERMAIKFRISHYEMVFANFWTVYKDAQRASLRVQKLYIYQCTERKRGYVKRNPSRISV